LFAPCYDIHKAPKRLLKNQNGLGKFTLILREQGRLRSIRAEQLKTFGNNGSLTTGNYIADITTIKS
jgi:hypothetical protein